MSHDGMTRIRLQVMWNRLLSVVEEQAQTLVRTAFSTSPAKPAMSRPASSICRAGCWRRR